MGDLDLSVEVVWVLMEAGLGGGEEAVGRCCTICFMLPVFVREVPLLPLLMPLQHV